MISLTRLQKHCAYFVIGGCIQLISLFLPWYTFMIASDMSVSGWNLYLFEQWKPIYVIQPLTAELPSMTTAIVFGILNATYIGIGLSLGVIFLIKKEPTEIQKVTIIVYMLLGPVISFALLVTVLILCVMSGYYVPYVQIQVLVNSLTLTKTYSLSYGFLLSVLATGFLAIPLSQADYSKFISLPRHSRGRSPDKEVLTPTFVDVQKLENKYLSIVSKQEGSTR